VLSLPSLEGHIHTAQKERSEIIKDIKGLDKIKKEWIRRQVLYHNRIDILATEVLNYLVRPYHLSMMIYQFNHPDNLQLAFRGAGKCFQAGTKILMYDGTVKKVEDVVIGDKLIGPDSNPRTVLNLSNGEDNLYKIIPQQGESWVCNSKHILPLRGCGPYKGRFKNFTPEQYIKLANKQGRKFDDIPWKLYRTGVDFDKQCNELEVHPYFMGLGLSLRKIKNKKIPLHYLTSSRGNRLQLLAGLLDSNGNYDGDTFEIIQKQENLANQIAFLSRSLGFAAYVKKHIELTKYLSGECFKVTISGDLNKIPCRVESKKAKKRKIKNVLTTGFEIEDYGFGKYYGFQVDKDGLFLLGDFTVTHNSTTCTVTKCIHLLLKNPNLRIMIASKTAPNAEGFLKEIKGHFESNELLAEIFGQYYDARKVNKWDNKEIEVLPRTSRAKEASITCVGVDGTIVSKHYDVIIGDDLVDEENARTEHMRKKTQTWYYKTLEPTLEPPSLEVPHRGEFHRLGTRYHFEDLYGHLIKNELKNHHQIIKALNEKGQSPWHEKYPPEWFVAKRKKSGLLVFNCHSDDTEFLTENGWKKENEVVDDERLMTFNIDTGELELQNFYKRFHQYYEGEMIHLKNRGIDALVTPNHRMIGKPTYSKDKSWKIVRADELESVMDRSVYKVRIPTGGEWNGREIESFEIPYLKPKKINNTIDYSSKIVKMDDFLEFIGYFVSKGATSKHINRGTIMFTQNVGECCDKMVDCITRMGFVVKKYYYNKQQKSVEKHGGSPYVCVFSFRHFGLWDWLKKNCGDKSKHNKIPRFVMSLSKRQIKIVFQAAMDGDGSKSKNGYWYSTTSKRLNDDLSEMAIRIGFIWSYSYKKPDNKKWNDQWCGYTAPYDGTRNIVAAKKVPEKTANAGIKPSIKNIDYCGNIVCFATPNETLITRRNGRILISGNSQYQCDTEAMKGEIFQYDNCQLINIDEVPENIKVYVGVDLAIKQSESADLFAMVAIGVDYALNYYFLDYLEGHYRFNTQTKKIFEFYEKFDPIRIGVESNAYQESQIQNIEYEEEKHNKKNKNIEDKIKIPIFPVVTLKDKVTNAWKLSPDFEDKRVFFVKTPRVHIAIERFVLFPNGPKDLFDAYNIAVTASKKKKRRKRSQPGLFGTLSGG
jgi:phage terminase large subunit-like protein